MVTSATAAQPSVPLSEGQRLIDTFFAPSKTFSDLRRSAAWWAPFLILAIVSVAFHYVVDQKVGFRKVVENQLRIQPKQAERMDRLPADQRDRVMQQQVSFWKAFSYASPAVSLLVFLIVAALYFGTLKFVGGGDVRFKTMYALVVYAWLPYIVTYLLAVVSLIAGANPDSFFVQNPAATNLGALMDPTSSPVLYALLSSVDIITIWTMILAAIGITCISKVKRGAAMAVVFGWFGFWVLVKVGLAAASS